MLGAEAVGVLSIRGTEWRVSTGHDLLRDGRVDDVGSVVGEQVFAALAVELVEADSISAADHSLVIQSVGETETRSEIELRHVHQRAIGNRAAGLGLDRVCSCSGS